MRWQWGKWQKFADFGKTTKGKNKKRKVSFMAKKIWKSKTGVDDGLEIWSLYAYISEYQTECICRKKNNQELISVHIKNKIKKVCQPPSNDPHYRRKNFPLLFKLYWSLFRLFRELTWKTLVMMGCCRCLMSFLGSRCSPASRTSLCMRLSRAPVWRSPAWGGPPAA